MERSSRRCRVMYAPVDQISASAGYGSRFAGLLCGAHFVAAVVLQLAFRPRLTSTAARLLSVGGLSSRWIDKNHDLVRVFGAGGRLSGDETAIIITGIGAVLASPVRQCEASRSESAMETFRQFPEDHPAYTRGKAGFVEQALRSPGSNDAR